MISETGYKLLCILLLFLLFVNMIFFKVMVQNEIENNLHYYCSNETDLPIYLIKNPLDVGRLLFR